MVWREMDRGLTATVSRHPKVSSLLLHTMRYLFTFSDAVSYDTEEHDKRALAIVIVLPPGLIRIIDSICELVLSSDPISI
jgi:hypothetical protein